MWIQAQAYMTANNITTPAAQLAAGQVVQIAYPAPGTVSYNYTKFSAFCVAQGMTTTQAQAAAAAIYKYLNTTAPSAANSLLNGQLMSSAGVSLWTADSVTQLQELASIAGVPSSVATALVATVQKPTVPLYAQWAISPENWTLANVTYLSDMAKVEAVSSLVNQFLPILSPMCSALGNTVTTNATVNAWLQAQYKTTLSGGTPKLPATLAELWGFVSNGETS